MDCVRTILVAIDQSEHARHAVSRAALLGAELKANAVEVMRICDGTAEHSRLSRLHVDDVGDDAGDVLYRKSEAAETLLLQARRHSPATVASGSGCGPADIVERAKQISADLTVVAGQRERFIAGLVARFRNDELIRLSDLPVLLVNREPGTAYRKVLVAVDFSAESQQAARVAMALAPGAVFTFIHVLCGNEEAMMNMHGVSKDIVHAHRMRAREEARVRLNGFIDGLGPRKQLLSRVIKLGVPGPVIHSHAVEINADLIVAGKHGKSRFVDLFLGGVTQRLIDYGDCDLLVTTSPYEGEPAMPPAA